MSSFSIFQVLGAVIHLYSAYGAFTLQIREWIGSVVSFCGKLISSDIFSARNFKVFNGMKLVIHGFESLCSGSVCHWSFFGQCLLFWAVRCSKGELRDHKIIGYHHFRNDRWHFDLRLSLRKLKSISCYLFLKFWKYLIIGKKFKQAAQFKSNALRILWKISICIDKDLIVFFLIVEDILFNIFLKPFQ